MTPAETAIREALAAGPTPGPWRVDADGCRAGPEDGFSPFGGCGCCGSPWMSGATDAARQADAELIAACNPAALAELLAELDGERNRSQMYADLVRGVAVVLHGPGWSDTSKLPEEVARLRAEVEALRKDAERYRWLRDNTAGEWAICEWIDGDYTRDARAPHIVDAAIDTAKGGE